MLSIHEYSNAAQFLRDSWNAKKVRNPAFSMRAWATQLGLPNNTALSLMLAGKRLIPSKYIPLFIDSLKLSEVEGLYLETLVAYSRAQTAQLKEFHFKRMQALSPKPVVRMVELESYKALANPLHATILEMTDLKNFRADATWIQEKLWIKASIDEINKTLERLIALGLLKKSAGKLKKTHQHLSNRPDIADKGSQEYHHQVSVLAARAVQEQPLLCRDFNGFALNIKLADIPKAKKLLQKMVDRFIHDVEAPSLTGDSTYQFNVQFFSLNKIKDVK